MKKFDLDKRLLEYSVKIIRLSDLLPKSRSGTQISSQLIRSGTSPYANHGEAQGMESQKDFIHKMGICLKELRESERWLKLIAEVPLMAPDHKELCGLLKETDELIRIFAASIKTAKSHL